jgi:hypothetical protein
MKKIYDQVPAFIDSDISPKAFKKNWACLIRKIYNVEPLVCPECSGSMKIISFIEHDKIIAKILRHLDLWEIRKNNPPKEIIFRTMTGN